MAIEARAEQQLSKQGQDFVSGYDWWRYWTGELLCARQWGCIMASCRTLIVMEHCDNPQLEFIMPFTNRRGFFAFRRHDTQVFISRNGQFVYINMLRTPGNVYANELWYFDPDGPIVHQSFFCMRKINATAVTDDGKIVVPDGSGITIFGIEPPLSMVESVERDPDSNVPSLWTDYSETRIVLLRDPRDNIQVQQG